VDNLPPVRPCPEPRWMAEHLEGLASAPLLAPYSMDLTAANFVQVAAFALALN
jgi:hypothetical protein